MSDTDTKAVLRKLLTDHVGKENAITQSQLKDALDMRESTLRSEISRIREEREIPLANLRDGYYVVADREELQEYVAHINGIIDSKRKTIADTKEAFETFDSDDVDITPRPQEPTEACDECGTEIPEDEVMLWKSRPLCREHWEQAAQAQ